MTLTNARILAALEALRDLAQESLPGKLSYAIVKNARRMEQEIEDFDKARAAIAEAHEEGRHDEHSAQKEYQELLDAEVEVDVHMIDLALLEQVEIKPGALYAIDFMIAD